MDLRHIIVGTAGHIDHGKSTLVEALTGTHPDRLEEEKRRGITIDLGFAFLSLDGLRIGFVDVPGHEKFVRNMLAGAGGIDVVLLVVAADESIKPQTREHFEICKLLGISRGIVAVTKADLVDPDVLGLVKLEIDEFVRASFLDGAAIVPVSARTGTGLESLKAELVRAARAVSGRDSSRHFRLPIDRSFAMKGFGTVVTGTLVAGSLQIEDEVEPYPTGKRLRVRGMHSGGESVQRAQAGQRTAVNLAGIDHREISRGMCLAPPGVFEPTNRIDAQITLLPSAKKMKNRARVHFHQGTAETIAEVVLVEGDAVQPDSAAFAQLRLKDKLLMLPGDRFILRQFSPVVTTGGGIVLDVKPPRHRRNDASVTPALKIFANGSRPEALLALAQDSKTGTASLREKKGTVSAQELTARMGWTDAELGAAVQVLVAEGKLRIVSAPQQPLVFASLSAVSACAENIRAAVDRFHRENPLLPGIPRQDLRSRCGQRNETLFDSSLNDLVSARELAIAGDLVQRAGRTATLAPEEQRARELIEREFETAGLAVPNLAAVLEKLPVEAKRARNILQMLLRDQVLVRVTKDLVFHRSAVARLRELLARYRKEKGTQLAVPAFKELTGVSRKYAIPLLEYLDREQVTRRVGDERVIL